MRATDSSIKLLKVIKNPVTDHLPVGCRKLATSYTATKVVSPRELVPAEDPIAIVVGAMAHGKVYDCASCLDLPVYATTNNPHLNI